MCRALASEHGHEVVAVYVDDGISASTFKSRPGWAHLLADLEAGKTDVLVAQSEDRFTRQPMEKETLVLDVGRPGALTDEQAALAPHASGWRIGVDYRPDPRLFPGNRLPIFSA